MYLIFYILLLELTKNLKNNNNKVNKDKYKINKILKKKLINKRIFYLVSWKGYRSKYNLQKSIRYLNYLKKIQVFY